MHVAVCTEYTGGDSGICTYKEPMGRRWWEWHLTCAIVSQYSYCAFLSVAVHKPVHCPYDKNMSQLCSQMLVLMMLVDVHL